MSARRSGRLAMPASARLIPRAMLKRLDRRNRKRNAMFEGESRRDATRAARKKIDAQPSKSAAPPTPAPEPGLASRGAVDTPPATTAADADDAGAADAVDTIPHPQLLQIRKRKSGWALLADNMKEPAWVVSTKKRAVAWAREVAEFHACKLQIFKSDGTLQHEHAYAS